MPIFEYKCEKCGEITEFLHKSSKSRPTCEKCGSKSLNKLFSGFSVGSSSAERAPGCDKSCQNGGTCPLAG